ncbi:hypothetical protein JOF53_000342 [Crossiella equi]|uniref:Integral membrane protein n=1 Tax=Crossiella equi TaxID=130796 RepID=A0ABS5A4G3_9PSEU|nr:hypothetical protein [Crossiella equi]MBP2471470.1 hypothetical protein [Crossiella equi]
MTTATRPAALLRLALRLDAVASGGLGLLLLATSGLLADLLGLPQPLLLTAGGILVVFAAFVAWLGLRATPSRTGTKEVVAVNVLWLLASVAVAVLVPMNGLGLAFVLAQAGAVAVFAELQVVGLRRLV